MSKIQVEMVSHHDRDEDEDCLGDYCAVTLFIEGKPVKRFGDYYHDKGDVLLEGYIDCLKDLGYEFETVYTNLSDAVGYEVPGVDLHALKDVLGDTNA